MIALLFSLFLAAVTSDAGAATVNQTFRVYHHTDLIDVEGGDDYFTTNSHYLARFAYVALYAPGNTFVDVGVTDDDGYVTFNNVDTAVQYKLWLYGWHDQDNAGRDLFIREPISEGGGMLVAKSDPFNPTGSTLSISYDAAIPGQEWINAAAVASWTIRRRPTAFPTNSDNGAEYTIIMDDPDNCTPASTATATYCYADLAVYIDPSEPMFKSTIAHELGHELQHWALVPTPSSDPQDWMYESDYNAADDSDCQGDGGHQFTSKEYQMAAIVEGMAYYVAAVAFNQTQEDDCRLTPSGPILWDSGYGTQSLEYSCEGWDPATGHPLGIDDGGVEWYGYAVPATSYFDWESPSTDHDPCSVAGVVSNRGVEFDWLRFCWDLDNKGGLAMEDIIDAWVSAQPAGGTITNPWNKNDTGLSGDMPLERLNDAFDYLGFSGEWDDFAGPNGVDQ